MNSLGPLYAVFLTLDLRLAIAFLAVNTAFALGLAHLAFPGRPALDRGLIALGLILLLNAGGLLASSLLSRTPVRDFDAFALD